MPQYYNPGLFPATYNYPNGYANNIIGASNYMPIQQYSGAPGSTIYMYQVDGENAARGWNPPGGQMLPPNTIVPLFDADGEHVYFKSTDMYGRMNPIRKARVVFEEEQQVLPKEQNVNVDTSLDLSKYVTKDDLESMKQDIINVMNNMNNRSVTKNQNGSKSVLGQSVNVTGAVKGVE